jgi:transposase-like protein
MPKRRWTADEMRELLREQEESGIPLRAFAQALDVPHKTLEWWRTRLRDSEAAVRLVPVSIQEEPAVRAEIVVGDVVVRVLDADAHGIARLVRALASC